RHRSFSRDWSSDVCSPDLALAGLRGVGGDPGRRARGVLAAPGVLGGWEGGAKRRDRPALADLRGGCASTTRRSRAGPGTKSEGAKGSNGDHAQLDPSNEAHRAQRGSRSGVDLRSSGDPRGSAIMSSSTAKLCASIELNTPAVLGGARPLQVDPYFKLRP